MEQYISKSALVAEIERRIKNLYPKVGQGLVVTKILKDHYEDLLSFIDTPEVKEIGFDIGSPEGDKSSVKEVDLEDAVDDAKDLAMRDMAWKVHVMISEGKSISEIDHYVCGICDF